MNNTIVTIVLKDVSKSCRFLYFYVFWDSCNNNSFQVGTFLLPCHKACITALSCDDEEEVEKFDRLFQKYTVFKIVSIQSNLIANYIKWLEIIPYV